jgi:hypothetical protein
MTRRSGWHRKRPGPADTLRMAQYNTREHKALRARLLAELAEHPGQLCPQVINGVRCGRPMYVWQQIDLGHSDDRRTYIGLVHHLCNLRAAAIKANKTRKPARPARGFDASRPFTTSRIW